MIRSILLTITVTIPLLLVGCVSMALPKVSARLDEAPARPVLASRALTRESWEASRDELRRQFADEVYGPWPEHGPARIVSHEVIDTAAFDGAGTIEQYALSLAGRDTHLVTVRPNGAAGPLPVVVLQMFCGNRAVFDGREEIAGPVTPYAPSCGGGWEGMTVKMIFGRHIMSPPIARILEHGYALAFIYPGDIVPDTSRAAPDALAQLMPEADGEAGAIAAWAWVYSQAIGVLERYDRERMAVWGHSRNGKSALLAAAFDQRIDLVIAHQAGTGGTTLTRSYAGESVAQITNAYSYWFSPAYAAYAGHEDAIPVDQHQLIALMAPRPLLIGGAWRDQWSDPEGSFRAAEGANPVYALYGSEGLRQAGLDDFDPDADIALFMRRGLHGVTAVDWGRFLEFLDAHFAAD